MIRHVSLSFKRVDPLEELRYLVLAAQRDGNRALAALLRPHGVTPAQGEVVSVLARATAPLTVRELGERLVCEPGSPSRLVASLVQAGLVERRPHPQDGRATALALTADGRGTAAAVAQAEERFYSDLRARLGSQRDTEAALRTLRGIGGEGASSAALRRRLEDAW